ncbi:DNA-directed RNA polymerase subunit alpha [Spiroplasma platyhelix]|uniref:DNA-directed RNA polymerase subunit alpha n=1 Tax=Spiroplasma platyhelix PALS-1 TaxID=1276218 RepID=A0A846U1J3_9MOLU|nr:DNA-directed RNA polymerase subunit alpha [Spiroplasma platyhelix]MBE4704304.1 DNA-directed RNA polymerase subunit alpha [Spiroplasma platyhelix PALS-1]NKE38676.1 DNA-directed RNA polymerase subunit alpha [Spiroplasma platyhelix PALS-1]UJB28888.1 DNA-directed RNA polymerase subunit alpha [Spiroplasma platyhelix PALS-1]
MNQFLRPKFLLNQEDPNENYMEFNVSQLERGFATTLGNALRRTLLSSIPGVAIYGVRIQGVNHEFSTIKGVVENVSEIILNIKDIVLTSNNIAADSKIENLTLNVKGEAAVTAGDIVCPTGVEVVNKDLVIFHTTNRNLGLEVEFFVKKSRGYASFEENKKLVGNSMGIMAVDANFSPVTKVTYKVEPITKTIKGVDYEKLLLAIQTNGAISPASAISMAAKIFFGHLELFINLSDEVRNFEVIATSDNKENDNLNLVLEDLDLSARSYNCLKREGCKTLGDFYHKKLVELKDMENLGDKSLEDIITSVLTVFQIDKDAIDRIIKSFKKNFDKWKEKSLENIVDEYKDEGK